MMEETSNPSSETVIIIPAGKANRASFILFGLAFLFFGLPFIFVWGFSRFKIAFISFLTDYVPLIITLLTGILLHEILHAVTFAFFCKRNFKSVSFGIKWKHLSPYVHCMEDLSVSQYRIGTLMPGLVLGLLPLLLSVITGNGWFLVFGLFFTAGSAGDFLSVAKLNGLDKECRIYDHPDEAGFIVKAQSNR